MGKKLKSNKNSSLNGNSKLKSTLLFIMTVTLLLAIFSLRKTVVLNVNGEEREVVTFKGTVAGILKDADIDLTDNQVVKPDLSEMIDENDTITVRDRLNVELEIDGGKVQLATAEENIADMLQEEDYGVDEDDEVTPAIDSKIQEGMKIKVVRIKYEEERTIEPIDYDVETKKDSDLESGKTKVLQEGLKGEKEQLVKIKYADGKEVSRKVVSETVIKEPKTQVVAKGTKITVPTLSRGGEELNAKKVITCQATAYTPTGARTATGTVPRQASGNNYGTIAVDPRVIPLGTKVYVDGYGFAIAEDTGGAVKGNIIDLFMNSTSAAIQWGRRNVKVYILS